MHGNSNSGTAAAAAPAATSAARAEQRKQAQSTFDQIVRKKVNAAITPPQVVATTVQRPPTSGADSNSQQQLQPPVVRSPKGASASSHVHPATGGVARVSTHTPAAASASAPPQRPRAPLSVRAHADQKRLRAAPQQQYDDDEHLDSTGDEQNKENNSNINLARVRAAAVSANAASQNGADSNNHAAIARNPVRPTDSHAVAAEAFAAGEDAVPVAAAVATLPQPQSTATKKRKRAISNTASAPVSGELAKIQSLRKSRRSSSKLNWEIARITRLYMHPNDYDLFQADKSTVDQMLTQAEIAQKYGPRHKVFIDDKEAHTRFSFLNLKSPHSNKVGITPLLT
jgi:hypothetical protein